MGIICLRCPRSQAKGELARIAGGAVLKEQHRFFKSVMLATDLALIAGCCVTSYYARFEWLSAQIPPRDVPSYQTHAMPVELVAPLMLLVLLWMGLYQPRRDQRFFRESSEIIKNVIVGVGVVVVFFSLFRNVLFEGRHYSGWQYVVFGGITTIALLFWHFAFRLGLRVLRSRGWNLRHVAIIGTGRLGQVAYRTIARNSWTGIKPEFFIDHHKTTEKTSVAGLPVQGGMNDLEHLLEKFDISGVIIAIPGTAATRLPDLLQRLERYPLDVRVIPDVNPRYLPINLSIGEVDGMPVLSVRQSPMANGWGRVLKRGLDFGGALVALAIFGLPMIAIAIAVRTTGPGPIVFRQKRISVHGQRFDIFKFRTMSHVEPEEQALRDAGKGTAAWTTADDPRITRVGRFLRKTSLDELPQLFNVLLGEMSLVGPRPERPELIQRFREDWRGYMLRQNVKAGMTGWAQVNGLRGATSLKKRLQYDLFYIRNWSIMFDLRILWMTIFRGFIHRNAA